MLRLGSMRDPEVCPCLHVFQKVWGVVERQEGKGIVWFSLQGNAAANSKEGITELLHLAEAR